MAATRFSDLETLTSYLTKSRPKYTTTSGLQIHFRFDHDDFLQAFFEMRSISRHFRLFRAFLKVLPGFWILLPVHTFRFVAPCLLIGSISCSLCAIRHTRQNTAIRSVPMALEAKPEVVIWQRPNFLTQRPRLPIWTKVGQSTQLLPVLQINFRFDHDDFLHAFFELRSISRHFGHFCKYFRFLNCTSGPQL